MVPELEQFDLSQIHTLTGRWIATGYRPGTVHAGLTTRCPEGMNEC